MIEDNVSLELAMGGSTQDFNARRMRMHEDYSNSYYVSVPAVTDISLPQTITCRNSNLKVNT